MPFAPSSKKPNKLRAWKAREGRERLLDRAVSAVRLVIPNPSLCLQTCFLLERILDVVMPAHGFTLRLGSLRVFPMDPADRNGPLFMDPRDPDGVGDGPLPPGHPFHAWLETASGEFLDPSILLTLHAEGYAVDAGSYTLGLGRTTILSGLRLIYEELPELEVLGVAESEPHLALAMSCALTGEPRELGANYLDVGWRSARVGARSPRADVPAPRINSIEAWLALPLLDDGTHDVHNIGVLLAPLGRCRELGVPGLPPPERDESELGVTLATAETPGAIGLVLHRVPAEFGGIARLVLEDGMRARAAGHPFFPARYRFGHAADGSTFIVPFEGPPLVVYVDESGNAGDVTSTEDPGTDQPVFALAGIVEVTNGELAELVTMLREKHGVQSTQQQLKYKNSKSALINDVFSMLCAHNLPMVVEVMDKQFYAVANMVTFAILGRDVPFNGDEGLTTMNDFADALIETTGSDVRVAYRNLAREPTSDHLREFDDVLRGAMSTATGKHPDRRAVLEAIDATWQATVASRRLDYGDTENLWTSFRPRPDYTAVNNPQPMLPNNSAFTYLCARLNRHGDRNQQVLIRHDRQLEFASIFEGTLAALEGLSDADSAYMNSQAATLDGNWKFTPGRFSLEFVNALAVPAIQIADVVAGFGVERLNEIIDGRAPPPWSDEIVRLVGQQQHPVFNVGTSTTRAKRFHLTRKVRVGRVVRA